MHLISVFHSTPQSNLNKSRGNIHHVINVCVRCQPAKRLVGDVSVGQTAIAKAERS